MNVSSLPFFRETQRRANRHSIVDADFSSVSRDERNFALGVDQSFFHCSLLSFRLITVKVSNQFKQCVDEVVIRFRSSVVCAKGRPSPINWHHKPALYLTWRKKPWLKSLIPAGCACALLSLADYIIPGSCPRFSAVAASIYAEQ